jgi:hypothetical protein
MPARNCAKPKDELPFQNRLIDLNVMREFNSLVDMRCDRNTLEALMRYIELAKSIDTWEKLIGFRRREIQTVMKQILACANSLERIEKSLYGSAYLLKLRALDSEAGALWPEVPTLLRQFVENFDLDLKTKQMQLQPRSHPLFNYVIALLVRHVIAKTQRPRDNQVAALIAAFSSRCDFTADALKAWRKKYARQLGSNELTVHDFLLR